MNLKTRDIAVMLLEENIHGIKYAMEPACISRSIAAHLFMANEVDKFKQFSNDKIKIYTKVVEHLKTLSEDTLI